MMPHKENLLSKFNRIFTEPCWCGTRDEGECPSCNLAASVRRELEILPRQVEELRRQRDELAEACREFVRKVECGEARSKRSYKQMKAALANLEADDE